ncbi:poly hydrolase [Mycena rebaudengoi]|nr:poly hydrolase [Mycena rebaudengoi]
MSGTARQQMLSGKTPFFASTLDQRFSFCLYVPTCHSFEGPPLPLLVVIHGTRRQTGSYINHLKSFSESHRCIVLCPLFPAGIIDPMDVNNYKTLLYHDIRFDLVLLSMIDQAAATWSIITQKFFLHGFSGGGQFAHRFLYLHPTRLAAVSAGAPGNITHPDTTIPWPNGLADCAQVFGIHTAPDFDEISRVPLQLVVGEKDTDGGMLGKDDRAGRTRIDRIKYLHKALSACGVSAELVVVPGVAHDGLKCISAVERWLAPLIDARA